MANLDGNDSLATISDVQRITEPAYASQLVIAESRILKPKGGPHAPWRHVVPPPIPHKSEASTSDTPTVLSDKKISEGPLAHIVTTHESPVMKDIPLNHLHRKAGHIPISSQFHLASHRTRYDDNDDEDLDRIANIKRKKMLANLQRGKSVVDDSIFWEKGEFSFPYRTFRPKVQVPTHVPPGSTPQGIIADRLHRTYKKLDLQTLLTSLGVEYADLLPPPNYGEQNARFSQESMWRNRSRISGIEKRTYIYGQQDGAPPQGFDQDDSDSGSGNSYFSSETSYDKVADDTSEANRNAYIQTKTQFGHNFPLEFFDNEDFDIRSPDDWMALRASMRGEDKYPLPAKAYMPMPPSSQPELIMSLSQITAEMLLEKTLKLQAFRKWLVKQRYRRIVQDARERNGLLSEDLRSDARIGSMIPAGTTVKSLGETSADESSITLTVKKSRLDSEFGVSSPPLSKMYSWEYPGESELESLSLISFEQLSLDDFMSQFSKGNATGNGEQVVELVKRSQSILSDLWSDPNSLEYLLKIPMDDEDIPGEDPLEYDLRLKEAEQAKFNESMRIIASKAAQDGQRADGLGSPDVDAFSMSSSLEYVFDYNKMKKVHIYNWKWVDVAVFEFDTVHKRYLVRTLASPVVFAWVPKVYLCFDAEDPNVHAERVKDAIDKRERFETTLRYNLYVDCLPVDEAPEIPNQWMRRIEPKVLSTPKLHNRPKALEMAKKEVNLDHMRAHNNMLFDYITEAHPRAYNTWVHTEDYYRLTHESGSDWAKFQSRAVECTTSIFSFKKYRLEQSSVIYTPQPFAAFSEILVSARQARARPVILPRLGKPLELEVFVGRQKEQIRLTKQFVATDWLEFIVKTIRINLEKVPTSWYNMEESEWHAYEVSKISKYLKLVKFLMEDTLRSMVLDSIGGFLSELRILTEPCSNIGDDYEWTENINATEFPPPPGHLPLWLLELRISRRGPTYSHYLSEFPTSLTDLIVTGVQSTHNVPDIMPMIMTNLLLGVKLMLSSVTTQEISPSIDELQELLRRALVPVDVYAQQYTKFMPVWHLDLDDFMEEWNARNHQAKEVRDAVDAHIREYDDFEAEIPLKIDIGPFRIDVEFLKTELLRRKKHVYMSILKSFAVTRYNQVLEILAHYEEIEKTLSIRSDRIEETMEQKHFLAGVPIMLAKDEELLQSIMRDYEIFERFKFRIPAEHFEGRWAAMMGLRKMYTFADQAVRLLTNDYHRLLHVQKADLVTLSETVDDVKAAVARLSKFVEVENVAEANQEVEEVATIVEELQERSDIFNQRQILFGLPPVQKEMLARLAEDLRKYKSMWFTITEWLRIERDAFNTPMNELDMESMDHLITEGLRVMRKSVKYFGFIGEIQVQRLARRVKRQIADFRKLAPLVLTVINPSLRQRHLEKISEMSGIPILISPSHTLQELISLGVGPHVEEIAKIGEDSNHELEIELLLNKMELEAKEVRVVLEKHVETGIEVPVVPTDTEEFLESWSKEITTALESVYKEPFTVYLDSWKKKLYIATETLKKVLTTGSTWIEFQISFPLEGTESKTPAELKILMKMTRVWRRITRIIRVIPQVLEFGSDKTLIASIAAFEELDSNVRNLMEERMKPKGSDADDD